MQFKYSDIEAELHSRPFDVVWLDYCSELTPRRERAIEKAVKLNPKVLAITLMCKREKAYEFHNHAQRAFFVLGIVANASDEKGWRLEYHKVYCDTRSPMAMYVFVRHT